MNGRQWARRAWTALGRSRTCIRPPARTWPDRFGRRWALWCDGRWVDVLDLPSTTRRTLYDVANGAALDRPESGSYVGDVHPPFGQPAAPGQDRVVWTGREWVDLPLTFAEQTRPMTARGVCMPCRRGQHDGCLRAWSGGNQVMQVCGCGHQRTEQAAGS